VQTDAASTGFVVLFCFANFFANFGPNTTTFIIPGEAFPTRYRSTSHGISAASGKFGAILTQVIIFGLPKDSDNNWIRILLGIFAAFMATGFFSTLLIPETKGRTLEDVSNEEQKGFVQGPATVPNYPLQERSNIIAAGPYQHYPTSRL
jgi:PHS family inorganic phosphate transporter-like MFS transporter